MSSEEVLEVSLGNVSLSETSQLNDSSEERKEQFQAKGVEPRKLTENEIARLGKDTQLVSSFKQTRLEIDAKKHWDLFYRRNKANFFKDRYWTFREFDELKDNDTESSTTNKLVLEIGCGVGNFAYPLVKHNKNVFVYACDFAPNAVQLLKSNPDYDETRMNGFVCDITQEDSLVSSLPDGVKLDIVTLIFVLSAIHPDKMRTAVLNIAKVLKPGGLVLVRDYGINDYSMIRFEPGHKLAEHHYARQDGTRTFFFSLEHMNQLFTQSFQFNKKSSNDINDTTTTTTTTKSLTTEASTTVLLFNKSISEYVFRETVNVKENLCVPRVFVQSKFIRTDESVFS